MSAGRPQENHRRFEEMAVAHVLGGLDDTDGQAFRSHLVDCGDCRARVGELRALAHDLADVERDERRLREAKTIETKKRAGDTPEEPAEPGPRARWVPILVILAILSLAAWNFTLRGNIAQLEASLDASMAAASVMEFGDEASVLHVARGVRGQVKADGEALVLLVDGVEDERLHGLYVRGENGDVLYRRAVSATSGRLYVMVPRPDGAETVLLTLPQSGPPASEPSGLTLFEAQLPA